MASPTLLQDSFAGGMKRDFSRDDMPPQSAWSLLDYIPAELGSPLRKRGGYTYSSPDLSTVAATASKVQGVFYAPFTAGSQLVAVDEDGRVFNVASSSSATDKGLAVPTRSMAFHRNLLIIGASDGTSAPQEYDGSAAPSALDGTPPAGGKYVAVYKDRVVLAGTSAQPQRVYFSAAGNPESWDTTNSFIDASAPVVGLASLSNALLLFTERRVERIRGAIPPDATTDGDMVLEPLYDASCIDNRTIAFYRDSCFFAATDGIYMTDGAAVAELSSQCGLRSYILSAIGAALASGRASSAGFHRGYYVFGFPLDGSVFVIEPFKKVAFVFQNFDANMFAASSGPGIASKLYFGREGTPRVGEFSSCFDPTAAVKADADGDSVLPVLETPFYFFRPGKKTWRHAYLSYGLRGSAADEPHMALSYINFPEGTSYKSLALVCHGEEETGFVWGTGVWGTGIWGPTPIGRTRHRMAVNATSEGLGFKVTQSAASSDTRLYALEAEFHPRELSRL